MITDLLKKSEFFARENSGTILTGIGVAGTVATAVLTGRSTIKALEILEEDFVAEHTVYDIVNEHSFKDKVRQTWPVFIPPIGVGTLTIASVLGAHRISSNKAAALAAAYGLSERALQEYKSKVVEKFGETKAQAVRDEIAQERVQQSPVSSQVIIAGSGDVLCFDMFTGRYFMSSAEKIRRAENAVNREVYAHEYASLSFFYDEIELPPTQISNDLGWNHDNICEVQFTTVKTEDDKPALAINFAIGPVTHYNRLY